MKPWRNPATHVGNSRKHRLAGIDYGTAKYAPQVARRLRAVNISTWSAAGVGGLFAIIDFLDPTPHAWRVGLVNLVGAIALSVPLLHRFGSTVGPIAFASIIYVNIFVTCSLIGTDTGMQMQFLAVAAATILFLGTGYPRLIALFERTSDRIFHDLPSSAIL